MTRSEVVEKISRLLGAYEHIARTRGATPDEGPAVARAIGKHAEDFIAGVDASVFDVWTDLSEGAVR